MYLVLSVIHGGNGLPIMAEAVFQYLLFESFHASGIPAGDIPDSVLQFIIEKVILHNYVIY